MSEKTYKGRGNYKTGGCCKFSCKNMNTKKCEDCFGFSKYEEKDELEWLGRERKK